MNFGESNHTQYSKHHSWEELYEEEDTYPDETDDYELWWSKRSLRKCLRNHELNANA